ncbi:MAG: hypothetical protein KJZ87_00625 [Thermoguttaceae bacterium]|nr:hypothetical protein [Thermoguttaceae bacterium]
MIHVLLMLATCSAAADVGKPLFSADADPKTLQRFAVDGYSGMVSGTVYPAGSLEQGGMPLGGLGTGYLCLDTDGRLGKCSIFNRLPAPMANGHPFLFLTVGGRRLVLATPKAIHYFGHFPVADLRYELDVPLAVELRAQLGDRRYLPRPQLLRSHGRLELSAGLRGPRHPRGLCPRWAHRPSREGGTVAYSHLL